MSKATFTFGRFNPPTEIGHGKLIDAVKAHAEKTGGQHYIFPSHTQDKKKNPLTHSDKVGAMRSIFKDTNVVSDPGIHSAIHAMQHLQRQGHDHVTMVVGSDRVENFKKLLNDYNGKEYNIKNIEVKSAGHRDPDAEGASGMSASKLRDLVKAGKKDEFISHYSNRKLGEKIHDKVHKAMNESVKAMFIMGGPGSGKDYVINNILNRFDLVEVQLDQILTGSARELLESNANLLINAPSDMEKIELVRAALGEDYEYLYTLVSVTNKVSRERNEDRTKPMNESVRIRKWIDAENTVNKFENMFVFKNSINLKEASESELESFKVQIADYLGFCVGNGLEMNEDLRTWFKQKWVRFDTKGKIKGDCAREEGEGKPKCLPKAQAQNMSKRDRAKAALRKRRKDPNPDRQGAPIMVATKEEVVLEANKPTNPELWSKAKSLARQKFDVYPSAYANGWAAKWYKSKGGGWKSVSESTDELDEDCWKGYKAVGMKMKNGRRVPNCVPVGEATVDPADQLDVNTQPTLVAASETKKKKKLKVPPNDINARIDGAGGYSIGGLTQTSSVYSEEEESMLKFKDFVNEATHNGREVPLNKPMKGDVKKSKVYVRDPSTGNIKKVNFGDKSLSIKSHIPARKKSYCARSGGQGNTTDKTKANYWSRRAWKC